MKQLRAIRPPQVQNREQDLELDDRADVAVPPDVAVLLARVRALEPPKGVPCRDCWTRGRAAVLRILEPAHQAPERLAELLSQAREVGPAVKERHWLDVFQAGRDAAVGAVEE